MVSPAFSRRSSTGLSARLEFALEQVKPAQWYHFERLASAFLGDEFGELRTLASEAGDGGRDSILYQPTDDLKTAAQYSVAADWATKVGRTIRRLLDEHADVNALIYLSPHRIGPDADSLRTRVRRQSDVYLDVRDRSWFIEREERSAVTRDAADEFCRAVATPILASRRLVDQGEETLDTHELRAALLYLVLQRRDDDMDRQLTRLCFDGLVKAVLRETDNEHRMSRPSIHEAVVDLLPTHPADEIRTYVDRALERLDKRAVRHWRGEDEFCLAYDERVRVENALAELALADEGFESEIIDQILFVADGIGLARELLSNEDLVLRVRRVLERFLLERGEGFVESLKTGQLIAFVSEEMLELAKADAFRHPDSSSIRQDVPRLVAEVVERVLVAPTDVVQSYLRALADGYTLFAFLRETPNVQSAVTKLFANGEIWLDATALLPLLAEELLEEPNRGYTRLLQAARHAGARFYVTTGIVEEVSSHLDRSLQAWRSPSTWVGRTPFMLASYLWSGHDRPGYPRWLERFRGSEQPTRDLIEYLAEVQGIRLLDLEALVEQADDELRWHAAEYWREVHESRRQGDIDPIVVQMLADHDVENFVGVLERRQGEEVGNPFGYTSWWLTLDSKAFMAAKEIAARVGLTRLDSPAMSFDFLTYYLAIGPARRQLSRKTGRELPLLLDTSLIDALPEALFEAAEEARRDVEGQPDYIVRRKIRDHMDKEKLRQGRVGKAGIEALEHDLRSALEAQARRG
jgi:hypothetical protein